MARLALLNKKTPSAQEHELQLFLTADMTFRTEDITDQDFPLKWWKSHSNLYPTIAIIAEATWRHRRVAVQWSDCFLRRLMFAVTAAVGCFLQQCPAASTA
ncbi:hypothetical protein KEM48_002725 [Puccinia striiformis f. sp. tritici PST-130]|nr:hypothetical protein KEM48_002725 [Puccinia striiformis f. sp. tritici PST-130]KNE93755.1 hypothetical protein PSTG_12858 [Puccinia striiformis f. sp. tritici PST-78]